MNDLPHPESFLFLARRAGFLLVHTAGPHQSKQASAEFLARLLCHECDATDNDLRGIANALTEFSWELSPGEFSEFEEGPSRTRHALLREGERPHTRADEALSVAYAAGLVAQNPEDSEALGTALLQGDLPTIGRLCGARSEAINPVIGVIAWLNGYPPSATPEQALQHPHAAAPEDARLLRERVPRTDRRPQSRSLFDLSWPTKFSRLAIERDKLAALRWLKALRWIRWPAAALAVGLVAWAWQQLTSFDDLARLLIGAAVGLGWLIGCWAVVSLSMARWGRQLRAVSPLAPSLYEHALSLAGQHIHLECYRRAVVAHRELVHGDYEAMQAFAERTLACAALPEASGDFAAAQKRRLTAFRSLHAAS